MHFVYEGVNALIAGFCLESTLYTFVRCAAKCREGKLPHQKEEMRRWDMEEKEENRRWDVQQREEKRRWDLKYKEDCRRWNMELQHELNLAMINREVTVTLERNGVKATFSGPPDVIKEMMRNGSRYVYDDELEMLN